MKSVKVLKKITALLAAAAIIAAAFAGCSSGGSSSADGKSSDGSSGSKCLDTAFDYAEKKVNDYLSSENLLNAKFATNSFNKAEAVSMMANDKTTAEDFEKIAKYMGVDSIYIADGSGAITASYPDNGSKGKAVKDIKEIATFNRLVKGVVIKMQSDPQPIEGTDEHSLYAGVSRPDGAGFVIVGYTTDEYSDVLGTNLAEKCGVNTIILREGSIISSTVDTVKAGSELDVLDISEDDLNSSFTTTIDGKKYDCKSEELDSLVLISAVPA